MPMTQHQQSGRRIQPLSSFSQKSSFGFILLSLKEGYWIVPAVDEIIKNKLLVEGLIVGCGQSMVRWNGLTNLKELPRPLREILFIGPNLVQLVCDQIAQGLSMPLNKPCIATFKLSNCPALHLLKAMCQNNGTKLIHVDYSLGTFSVSIPNFNRQSQRNESLGTIYSRKQKQLVGKTQQNG